MVSEGELDRFHIELTKSILESRPPKFLYYNKRYDIESIRYLTYPIDSMNRDFNNPETWATVSPDHDDETHQRGLDAIDEFFDIEGYQASTPQPSKTADTAARSLPGDQATADQAPQAAGISSQLPLNVAIIEKLWDFAYQGALGHDARQIAIEAQGTFGHGLMKADRELQARVTASNAKEADVTPGKIPAMTTEASPSIAMPWTAEVFSAGFITPAGAYIRDVLSAQPHPATGPIPGFVDVPPADHPVAQTHQQLQAALMMQSSMLGHIQHPSNATANGTIVHSQLPVSALIANLPRQTTGPIVLNPEDSVHYQAYLAREAAAALEMAQTSGSDIQVVSASGLDDSTYLAANTRDGGISSVNQPSVNDDTDAALERGMERREPVKPAATGPSRRKPVSLQQIAEVVRHTGGIAEGWIERHNNNHSEEKTATDPEDDVNMQDDEPGEVERMDVEPQTAEPEDAETEAAEAEAAEPEATQGELQSEPTATKRKAAKADMVASLTTGDTKSTFERFLANIDPTAPRQPRHRANTEAVDKPADETETKVKTKPTGRKAQGKAAARKTAAKPANRVAKTRKEETVRKQAPALKRKK